jgi:cytoskeletal protein CcmA (bactofilin family)
MFKASKKSEATAPVHSILGKDTLWQGEIHAGSLPLRIEGTVEGTITSEGEVTVAPSGHVTGTLKAKHLIVTGKVSGLVDIQGCLEIHGTGCVEGEVTSGALVVDEGGTLQGTSVRRGHKGEEAGKARKDKGPVPATGPAEELAILRGK